MNYLNPLKNDLFPKVNLNMCQNVKPRDCEGIMFFIVCLSESCLRGWCQCFRDWWLNEAGFKKKGMNIQLHDDE